MPDRAEVMGAKCTLLPRMLAISRGLLLFVTLAGALVARPGHVLAAELVMFETPGCPWCAAWNRDVGVIYAKTEEGRIAPLRRVDIGALRPVDLGGLEGILYTPTFVLVEEGVEVGRIVGYLGEDHFWGLLSEMLQRLPGASGS